MAVPDQATAYQPGQVKGAAFRVPDLPSESAWPLAQAQLDEAASAECRQAAGAQHLRNFGLRADYESLHWTQMLLPLYVIWYTDDQGQPHTLYLNGQSGVIGGKRLVSQRKGGQIAGGSGGGLYPGVAAGRDWAGFPAQQAWRSAYSSE